MSVAHLQCSQTLNLAPQTVLIRWPQATKPRDLDSGVWLALLEEAAKVEPVGLLAIEERRLQDGTK